MTDSPKSDMGERCLSEALILGHAGQRYDAPRTAVAPDLQVVLTHGLNMRGKREGSIVWRG